MAKKYLDQDGLLYFWQKITNAFVKKDGNKVLSTNDYTTTEKNKLSGIATGAQVNKIETVQVNGSALTITNKTVNVGVPEKLSDLTNDGNFVADADYVHTDNNFTTEEKNKLANTNVAYGTSTTGASTAAKVITVTGNTNWTLSAGSIIVVKFNATNSASNPTFNVNGTGAKNVWYNTGLITTSNLGYAGTANRPMYYVYDGTQFIFMGWSTDSNTTYTPQGLGFGYGTCATAEATAAKVVTLSGYALVNNGFVSVKFTYGVPASATMNINSKGAKAIYWKGSAITDGVIQAGDTATFVYISNTYHLVSIDRGFTEAGENHLNHTIHGGLLSKTDTEFLYGLKYKADDEEANLDVLYVNNEPLSVTKNSMISTDGANYNYYSGFITIPTNNNQLTNGAGYQTASQVQTAINTAISGMTGIDYKIVTSLPTTGEKGTIYLLANSGSETQNIYDEYIYVNSKWEKIGTTAVDLSDYVKNSDLVKITNTEIDTIVAN